MVLVDELGSALRNGGWEVAVRRLAWGWGWQRGWWALEPQVEEAYAMGGCRRCWALAGRPIREKGAILRVHSVDALARRADGAKTRPAFMLGGMEWNPSTSSGCADTTRYFRPFPLRTVPDGWELVNCRLRHFRLRASARGNAVRQSVSPSGQGCPGGMASRISLAWSGVQ